MNININGITPFATIILPPGSTSADLQAAINGAAYGDVIAISGNMSFSSAVTVPAGASVTIQSGAGGSWTMNTAAAGYRHFITAGILTLANIVLGGNGTGGGVQLSSGGSLNLNAGAVITNCYFANGGGVYAEANTTVSISGGHIDANNATNGGGIYTSGNVTMSSGAINGNHATLIGGGIYDYGSTTTIDLNGGTLNANTATGSGGIGGSGGGIYAFQPSSVINLNGVEAGYNNAIYGGAVMSNGTVNMSTGRIIGNTATYGGGVYMTGYSMTAPLAMFNLNGGEITGNTADNGGGLYSRGNFPGVRIGIDSGAIHGNGAIRGGGIYLSLESGGSSSLVMGGGAIYANTASNYGGGVFVSSGAIFTLNGGIVGAATTAQGNTAGSGGGVYVTGPAGSFAMAGGEIGGNAAIVSNYGGGGVFLDGASMSMHDGSIHANTSVGDGGGVYMYNNNSLTGVTTNTFSQQGGTISGNTTARRGGGVYVDSVNNNTSTYDLQDGAVSLNMALNGGGVYGEGNTTINVTNGTITANTASQNGGGMYAAPNAVIAVAGNTLITANRAGDDGGGIYTDYAGYSNLTTGPGTVFSENTASAAYVPPVNASLLYPNIGFASTSVANHPLNNYDINFTDGELLVSSVSYSANGGQGGYVDTGVPYGASYTVLSAAEANVSRAGCVFAGWNTRPDGTGAAYNPGDRITVTGDLTLYAQWAPPTPPCPPVPCAPTCCPPACCPPCAPCRRVCSPPRARGCGTCARPLLGTGALQHLLR